MHVALPIIPVPLCILNIAFSIVLEGRINLIVGSCACTGSLAAVRANLLWKIARPFPCKLNDSISFAAIPEVLIAGCSSTIYNCRGDVKSNAVRSVLLASSAKFICGAKPNISRPTALNPVPADACLKWHQLPYSRNYKQPTRR